MQPAGLTLGRQVLQVSTSNSRTGEVSLTHQGAVVERAVAGDGLGRRTYRAAVIPDGLAAAGCCAAEVLLRSVRQVTLKNISGDQQLVVLTSDRPAEVSFHLSSSFESEFQSPPPPSTSTQWKQQQRSGIRKHR